FDQALGPTVAYWNNLLQASPGTPPTPGTMYMMPTGVATPDIAQAAYALYVTSGAFVGDEVVGLGNIDLFGLLKDTSGNSYFINGKPGGLRNKQLTTSYAWSAIGRSNYNAMKTNLRKHFRHGVQFDLNYPYPKSIDFPPGASRLGFRGTANIGAPGS